ncbi:MFS transporter [Neorhizobium sp. P12A]|uniref:MFS transporter n=1 Tax=Neorhizobium sp. P12A TaxID=2268027 RepID=UPI0011ECF0CA|nr:MFS transporter [Neorhizobium sp. P12A]KAA0695621.1 MFS transporter [Neorhizobium sp. P12A]
MLSEDGQSEIERPIAMQSVGSRGTASFTGSVGVLLALAMFINFLDRGNLATAAPLIKEELNLTNTQFGLLVSAFFWVYVPNQLAAAWLVVTFSAYRALVVGLIVWSIATILTGFAGGFVSLLALRILLGIGESASFPATSKLLAQNLPPERLGFANALVSAGIILGPAAGTFLGGLLIAHFGWRPLFILFGLASLLWLVPWLRLQRPVEELVENRNASGPTFREILTRRELWGAAMGHFASNYTFYTITTWLPLYLVKVQGFTIPQMALVGGLVYAASALFSLCGGWIADRWMSAGGSANRVRKTFIGASCVVAIVCMLMCASGNTELAVAGLLLSSIGQGLGGFNLYAIGQTLAGPTGTAKWIGLQNCIGNMSGIVAPIFTGLIVDATGAYTPAFFVAAGMSLAALVSWTIVIPRIQRIDWK